MTNPSKDTITVHCIVERIATYALNALMVRQLTTENSQNDETMELDNNFNKNSSLLSNNNNKSNSNSNNNSTSSFALPSTNLLSDLLQQSSCKEEPKDEFNLNDDESRIKDEFKSEKDDFEFKQNLDDRPKSLSEQSNKERKSPNQFELDRFPNDHSAIKENFSNKSPFNLQLNASKDKKPSFIADLLRFKDQPNNYKVEDEFNAELPANTPLQELVKCALGKQGYSADDCSSAKGFIELRNWKPLTLEQISDDSETTILDILGDVATIATLRVRLSTIRSKSNCDFKDKLLQFLLTQCYGTLSNPAFSSSPELLNTFNTKLFDLINESNSNIKASAKELENNNLNDDEKLEPWYLQQLLSTLGQQSTQQVQQTNQQPQFNNGERRSVNSNSSNSSLANCNSNNSTTNLELDTKQQTKHSPLGFSTSFSNNNSHNSPTDEPTDNPFSLNQSLLNSQNRLNVNNSNNLNNSNNHQQTSNSTSSNSFPNRTRIRTSFDPEHELPKLHRWFSENQHPTRPQIQEYVRILNNLESRRGRKPLDVNNVVYWFKNSRAAAKRNPGGLVRLSSGQSPQQQSQLNGQSVNNLGNDQLNAASELMFAQFNQQNQRQLINQLQLLNQHPNANIAELLSTGAGKNALKNLMLKNAGLIDDDGLLNCDQNEDDDQQMKDSEDEDQQNEDTEQAFSNFAQTLDLSVKQQQQHQNSGNNLKRRKVDTSSTFDECEDQDEKDSTGSASPINHQLSSLNKRNNQLNNNNKQRFSSLNKQLNTLNSSLKSFSQGLNQSNQQRHMLLDQVSQDKDDNQQQLVNSDGELDDENQESDGELDEKDYYASMLNANRNNNIGQLAQNLVGNNLAANFLNANYLQQTMNDLFVNRLIASQSNNVASALAGNNNLLSSAAGLIAASSAGGLNSSNSHPLSALTGNSNAFGQNSLLSSLNNNPNSPDDGMRKIRRSRTFIDPITEVPRLEQWFSQSTHPSHAQILCYTDELNNLPYRQKFPKLESKNVQFWFKNRRAKFKRVGLSNTNNQLNQTGQTNSSTTASLTTTSQSNSQSDSPTPPASDLLCMNGNREFVGRLVH